MVKERKTLRVFLWPQLGSRPDRWPSAVRGGRGRWGRRRGTGRSRTRPGAHGVGVVWGVFDFMRSRIAKSEQFLQPKHARSKKVYKTHNIVPEVPHSGHHEDQWWKSKIRRWLGDLGTFRGGEPGELLGRDRGTRARRGSAMGPVASPQRRVPAGTTGYGVNQPGRRIREYNRRGGSKNPRSRAHGPLSVTRVTGPSWTSRSPSSPRMEAGPRPRRTAPVGRLSRICNLEISQLCVGQYMSETQKFKFIVVHWVSYLNA